jgi:hypothetical protein
MLARAPPTHAVSQPKRKPERPPCKEERRSEKVSIALREKEGRGAHDEGEEPYEAIDLQMNSVSEDVDEEISVKAYLVLPVGGDV